MKCIIYDYFLYKIHFFCFISFNHFTFNLISRPIFIKTFVAVQAESAVENTTTALLQLVNTTFVISPNGVKVSIRVCRLNSLTPSRLVFHRTLIESNRGVSSGRYVWANSLYFKSTSWSLSDGCSWRRDLFWWLRLRPQVHGFNFWNVSISNNFWMWFTLKIFGLVRKLGYFLTIQGVDKLFQGWYFLWVVTPWKNSKNSLSP